MYWSALALTLGLALTTSGTSNDTPDVLVLPEHAQIEILQAHYAQAVSELAAVDVSALTPAQRAERARLIGVLSDFGLRGEFGHNLEYPSTRVPHFRDADGRRCAVAEMMHASGEDAFVEQVQAERNHAWICDLRGDPRFEAWLVRSGFTIEEAGRIHGPPIIVQPHPPSPQPTVTTPTPTTNGRTRETGVPPSGSTPRPSTGSSGAGPSTPRTPSGPATPTPSARTANTGNAPRPATLTLTDDDTWWLWWEYNKVQYLLPNRLTLANAPVSGYDADGTLRNAILRARDSVMPTFEKALGDTDAGVRATAAVALGRVGGTRSVSHLLPLLDDPNVDVRHKTILALGATGSAEAIEPLLAIARFGARTENASRISSQARALAIVALGLARRQAGDDRLDVEIAKLIQNRAGGDREPIGVAALIYQMLAPSLELERYALIMAKDETESPSVRCRAVESLRSSSDDKVLAELQRFLNGPRLDLRRSAALALGGCENSLALPALMVAYEVEAESLTRGFLLVSMGKQGGAKAQSYLMHVLEKGETGMRRWAALALGIEARNVTDPEVAATLSSAIRTAALREKNQDSVGAYWLASGLARDTEAWPSIRDGLTECGNPRQRMYAASALALLGGDPSLYVLRDRIKSESQAMVRVAIAQSLGVLGRTSDVAPMFDMLMHLSEPALQAQGATAMAAHGTPDALRALMELARLETGSNVRRAAALEGLGMILSPQPAMTFATVSREANYTVFADWVNDIFQTTL